MPILILFLGLGVVLFLWWTRRNSTLTRLCRWRLDRDLGEGEWRCASCGARCTLEPGQTPRHCLRDPAA